MSKKKQLTREPGRRGRPPKGEETGLSHEPLPSSPVAAIGIDIGVEGFHLCVPGAPSQDVKDWPVWHINYEKQPDWRDVLRRLITKETVVLAEPTGWNYLSPVARVVALESPGEMWLIEHSRTAAVRGILNFQHKTDLMDTRALCYAAVQLTISRRFAGCWRFDWAQSEALLHLRFLVNAHFKATNDRTRFSNRLRHIGHSVAPELNMGTAWFRCMAHNAFTPAEIHALDVSSLPAPTRRAVERLRERVPAETHVPAPVYSALLETYRGYAESDARAEELSAAIVAAATSGPFAQQFERLMTFPLASPVGCAAIIVATKGLGDQMRVPEFRACLGTYPKVKQSGDKVKSRTARKGYRPAMKIIHMWAQVLCSPSAPDNVVRRYFAGGEKNGGRKFSAAKARLALSLLGVLKSPEGYNPEKMAVWINRRRAAEAAPEQAATQSDVG
jgi:hypothetical protein